MRNIVILPWAKKDLIEIQQYISQDNTVYADKVIETIFAYISWLIASFPEIWREVPQKYFRQITEPTFKYTIIVTTQV